MTYLYSMTNTQTYAPRYTAAEYASFRIRVNAANVPPSLANAFEVAGAYSKTIMTGAGPCFPCACAAATGRTVGAVVGTLGADTVDGTSFDIDELNAGTPERLQQVTKGIANRDFIPRNDLRGKTLAEAAASGGTFVAFVGGGGHAVCVKNGILYDTAGKSLRQRARWIYELV